MTDADEITYEMMTQAGIDTTLVFRSPTNDGHTLIKRDHKICFGPATTETGEAAPGWDITGYTYKDGGWVDSIQEYELTADAAVRKVADLQGPD